MRDGTVYCVKIMTNSMSNSTIPDAILKEALQWHLRISAPDAPADIWESFDDWLKQDQINNAAYDEISLADKDLDQWKAWQSESVEPDASAVDLPAADAENDNEKGAGRPWYAYGGLGIAASLILAIVMWPQLSGPELKSIITQPGQTQTVQLGEGSRIHVNGDSEIIVKSGDDRFAKLERGEAIFYVEHDDNRPFRVESGKFELIDRGTIFNVKRTDQEFSVGVSEGAVTFRNGNQTVEIDEGKVLSVDRRGSAILSSIDPAIVGGWTKKRLFYKLAPIKTVIADVNRNSGLSLSVDPAIASRSFSGSIQLHDDHDKLVQQLEQLLDVEAQDTKEGWLLTQ